MGTNFWSKYVKFFGHDGIEFKDGTIVLKLPNDPTSVAVDAPASSFGSFGSNLYVKTDAGSTTNWKVLADDAALQAHLVSTTAHAIADITYDNTTSGLTATDGQTAIDEVEARVDTAETNIGNNATAISDHLADTVGAHAASAISYDNSTSGLTATEAQAAIDEVEARLVTEEATGLNDNYSRSDGEIVLEDALGGIKIKDDATEINDSLLAITDNAGTTPYFDVSRDRVIYTDVEGRKVLRDEVDLLDVQDFKVDLPSGVYTVTGTAVVLDEEIASLDGYRSAKVIVAGGDLNSEIKAPFRTGLKKKEKESTLAYKFDWLYDGSSEDWSFRIEESSDGVAYVETMVRKLPSAATVADIEYLYKLRADTTHYRSFFKIDTEDVGKIAQWDNVRITKDPSVTAEFVQSESYEGLGHTGVGTGVTFSSETSDLGSLVKDISTTSKSFEVLKDCIITGVFSANRTVSTVLIQTSISVNGNIDKYLQRLDGVAGNAVMTLEAKKGDIFEPYWASGTLRTGGEGAFSFTATQTSSNKVFEGSNEDGGWNSFPVTIGLTGGTKSIESAKWRRDRKYMEVEGAFKWSSIFTGGSPNISLPSGYTIDSGFIDGTVQESIIKFGEARLLDSSDGSAYDGVVTYKTATEVSIEYTATINGNVYVYNTNPISTVQPFGWNTNDEIQFKFRVPIVGWNESDRDLLYAVSERFQYLAGENVDTSGNTRYFENFEDAGSEAYFTPTGTGSITVDTVSPIEGNRSVQLVAGAGAATFEGASLFVDRLEYKARSIAFNFLAETIESTGTWTVGVEAWNGATWDNLGNVAIETGGKTYDVLFSLADNHTSVRLVPESGVASTLEIDKISIDLKPNSTAEFVQSETITYTGYTSKNGLSQILLSTELYNDSGKILNLSQTDHTRYTFNKKASFVSTLKFNNAASVFVSIIRYDKDDNIISRYYGRSGTGGVASVPLSGVANTGDYLIYNTDGVPANSTETQFTVTATRNSSNVVFKGQSGGNTQEKILSVNHTSTADIPDLQFDGLEIGKEYHVTGNVSGFDNSAGQVGIDFRSGSAGSGDLYGTSYVELNTGNLFTGVGVSFKFIATSNTMYSKSTVTSGGRIDGNGTKLRTFIQLSPTEVINSIPITDEVENVYSAKIDAIGVVSDENTHWITSTSYAAGITTLNLAAGIDGLTLKLAPVSSNQNVQALIVEANRTATSVDILTQVSSSLALGQFPFHVIAQRGSDYKAPQGHFAVNVPLSSGVTSSINNGIPFWTGRKLDGRKIMKIEYLEPVSHNSTFTIDTLPTGLEIIDYGGRWKTGNLWIQLPYVAAGSGSSTGYFDYDESTGVFRFWIVAITAAQTRAYIEYLE